LHDGSTVSGDPNSSDHPEGTPAFEHAPVSEPLVNDCAQTGAAENVKLSIAAVVICFHLMTRAPE
jgi:hypothetical protein